MSVILSVVGAVAAVVGLVLVGYSVPRGAFTAGPALLSAGTTALLGGLILIGLSAVAAELRRLTQAVEAQAVARVVRAPIGARPPHIATEAPSVAPAAPEAEPLPLPNPMPAATDAVEETPAEERPIAPVATVGKPGGASPPERLRQSLAGLTRKDVEAGAAGPTEAPATADKPSIPQAPIEQAEEPEPMSLPAAANLAAPPPSAEAMNGTVAVPATPQIGPLQTEEAPAQPKRNIFDSVWPAEPLPGRTRPPLAPVPGAKAPPPSPQAPVAAPAAPMPAAAPVQPVAVAPPPRAEPTEERASPAKPAAPTPKAAILKSGVIEGMGYTLYADGSIEAELTHGTLRFGSINELRAHLEKKSA
jgi:hypothetical protein